MIDDESKWYVVFCGKDTTRMTVVNVAFKYKLDDYNRASCREFDSLKEATDYGRKLARKHGRTFIDDDDHTWLDAPEEEEMSVLDTVKASRDACLLRLARARPGTNGTARDLAEAKLSGAHDMAAEILEDLCKFLGEEL